MFGGLLRFAYADHVSQQSHVAQSNLDWIIVRPSAFTDGNRTGAYRHCFPSSDSTVALKISRADVVDFMLKRLTDKDCLHKTPGISY